MSQVKCEIVEEGSVWKSILRTCAKFGGLSLLHELSSHTECPKLQGQPADIQLNLQSYMHTRDEHLHDHELCPPCRIQQLAQACAIYTFSVADLAIIIAANRQ